MGSVTKNRGAWRKRSAATGKFFKTLGERYRVVTHDKRHHVVKVRLGEGGRGGYVAVVTVGGTRGGAGVKEFAHIDFRGPEQRAYLVGTGLDVWEVIEAYNAMGLAALLKESDLPRKKVFEAVRYYKRHREEIDRAIAENAEAESLLRETEPGLFSPLA